MLEPGRRVLRHLYSLIVIVVVTVSILVILISVSRSKERGARDRLARFHLRSMMLTVEASNRIGALARDLPTKFEPVARTHHGAQCTLESAIQKAAYSVGLSMDSISKLHLRWKQQADPFLDTVERAVLFADDLHDAADGNTLFNDDLSDLLSAFEFKLLQLERLHSIAARDLLDQLAVTERRTGRVITTGVSLALIVLGLIFARTLHLTRARLREHELMSEELLERERQLQQAKKMESLGTLVGGVAHDFNNLLTVILGCTVSALRGTESSDPRHKFLQQVRVAGERAAGLTGQLLAFSRKQAVDLCVVDFHALIREAEPMLRRLIRENIRLSIQLEAETPRVEVDPGQMELVLINLAINASDAMPNGGQLTLKTSDVDVKFWPLDCPAMSPGDYLRILVEDCGVGMTPETLSRIFDPFFTTKKHGRGTGLGLSSVHGVVTKNGGQVQVSSEPGAGTRFEIYLPRCNKPMVDRRGKARPAPIAGELETVLVAEDESLVRQLMVDGLRGAGYAVLEASNGVEALRVCANHAGPLHLIVSDVVMPELGGPEMIERALKIHPDARVLLVSGYSESKEFEHKPLLTKPFSVERMLMMVRQVLDASHDDEHAEVSAGSDPTRPVV